MIHIGFLTRLLAPTASSSAIFEYNQLFFLLHKPFDEVENE
ncbi:hypothetical protein [Enterococcus rivorum]|nr:hypothetical protein [Enterococcus rivorum]MBP2099873.1 hypothetical protein [Enterococcus rivorum]